MTISLVVPVYNAECTLGVLLHSILAQTRGFDQLIFVDNGSTDRSVTLLESFAAAHPELDVMVLREDRRNPGVARNRAIDHVRGEVVGFTDADCQLDPRWAEMAVAAFQSDLQLGILGGVETPVRRDPLIARYSAFVTATSRRPPAIVRSKSEWFDGNLVSTLNMAVRRQVLERLQGFVRWRAGEDMDFWMRALDLDISVRVHEPRLIVHHEPRVRLASYLARQWDYALAVPILLAHHFRGSMHVTTSRRLLVRCPMVTSLVELNPHTALVPLLVLFGWKSLAVYALFLAVKPIRFLIDSRRAAEPVTLADAIRMTAVFELFRWVVGAASLVGSVRHRVLCVR